MVPESSHPHRHTHITIRAFDTNFSIMRGLPDEHGLQPTTSHTLTLEGDRTTFWLVDCKLDLWQAFAIARPILNHSP